MPASEPTSSISPANAHVLLTPSAIRHGSSRPKLRLRAGHGARIERRPGRRAVDEHGGVLVARTRFEPVNNADPCGSLTTGYIKLLSEALGFFLDGVDLGKFLTTDEVSQINDVLIEVAAGVICEAIPGFNEVALGFGCIAVGELAESVAEQVNP